MTSNLSKEDCVPESQKTTEKPVAFKWVGEEEQHLAEQYDSRIVLPETRAPLPLIVGVIGNIGAGKSTLARQFERRLPGSVIVSANSVRYLLGRAGLPWGANVGQMVWVLTLRYAIRNYTVIVDGGMTERGARDNLHRIADAHGVPLWFVRLVTSTQVCRQRTFAKYIDADWISNFSELRIGEPEVMVKNVEARATAHESLRNEEIEGLLEIVHNDFDYPSLVTRARVVAESLTLHRSSWRQVRI